MKSSWIRAVALSVVLQGFGSACREAARQPAPPSAEKAASPPVAQVGEPQDCAAVRARHERFFAELPSALDVEEIDEEGSASDSATQVQRRDPRPAKYADKLASLLQKGALCEPSRRGLWFIRYAPSQLSTQAPGDVILPWSLVHVTTDGKSVEIASDPEDSSSADFTALQHDANKGATPQRPRFIAAVGAKFYIDERSREDGELSLPDALVLYDFDGDGEEEAILTEHSNSLGRQERSVTLWTFKAGRITPYAPAWQRIAEAARDVDGDGRPDLLYRPYWGERGPGGAELALAHALPNGTFSTSDAAAAAFHDKQPPPVPIRSDAAVEKIRDPLSPPPLLRAAPRPPTGMLCKREYERTRALLIGAPSYFARQHVPGARVAAEGLSSLLRKRSFCVPAQHGAWAVSFIGYQFGGPAAHGIMARWALYHIGLDGTRVAYVVPPRPATDSPASKADPMLPFDDTSSLSLEYYSDDNAAKLVCRNGYDLPSSLRVVDYDQKGEEEAIFSTTSEELGCNSEKFYLDPVAILTLRDGQNTLQIAPYDEKWHRRFDDLKDLDRDGRPDLLYRPYRTPTSVAASCPELRDGAPHDPFAHGPLFAAHALPQGGFSTLDQTAKDYARSSCPQRAKPATGPGRGEALLCARLWGQTAKAAVRELDGDGICSGCLDCEDRRRLRDWLERPPPLRLP